MQSKRINWIDYWKGFMLVIICLGHFNVPWKILNFFMPIHVASFFFLSGFLFTPQRTGTLKDFILFAIFFILFSRLMTRCQPFAFIAQNGIIILAVHYYVACTSRLIIPGHYVILPYIQLVAAIIFCALSIYIVNNYFPALVVNQKNEFILISIWR